MIPKVAKQPEIPPAPAHLSAEMQGFWTETVEEMDCEPHQLRILQLMCESWDTNAIATAKVAKEGITVTFKGNTRAHPAVAIARDAKVTFARLCRELGLELAMEEAPRSNPIRGRRR